jgi:hypothetical protein
MDIALKDTVGSDWKISRSTIDGNDAISFSTDFDNLFVTDSAISGNVLGYVNAFIENSSIIAPGGGAGDIQISYGSIVGTTLSGQIVFDSSFSPGPKGIRMEGCVITQESKLFLVDDYHKVSSCRFNLSGGATEGVGVTGSHCTVSCCTYTGPVSSKFVVESGGADLNTYADNTGFSGSVVIGPDSSVDDPIENSTLRGFFRKQGFLPAEVVKEELYNYPAPDFSNLNGGTLDRSMSRIKFTPGGVGAAANWGWDSGGEKSKLLAIMSLSRVKNAGIGIFFADSLPAASEIPDGSYLFNVQANTPDFEIFKKAGGGFTSLGSQTSVIPTDSFGAPSFGLAFYYDDATNRLIAFLRMGSEAWWPIIDITDASFTTMRYIGIRNGAASATQIVWSGVPLEIYAAP